MAFSWARGGHAWFPPSNAHPSPEAFHHLSGQTSPAGPGLSLVAGAGCPVLTCGFLPSTGWSRRVGGPVPAVGPADTADEASKEPPPPGPSGLTAWRCRPPLASGGQASVRPPSHAGALNPPALCCVRPGAPRCRARPFSGALATTCGGVSSPSPNRKPNDLVCSHAS